MNILSTVKKCITGGDWFIAIRKIGENKYHVLDNIGNTWCADPLLFEEKGICYLFVEQYNKKKDRGEIGYYRIDNGIPLSKGVII